MASYFAHISIGVAQEFIFLSMPDHHGQYNLIQTGFPAAPKIKSPTLLEKLPGPDLPFDLYASAASADMALLPGTISTINQLRLPFMRVRLNICLGNVKTWNLRARWADV